MGAADVDAELRLAAEHRVGDAGGGVIEDLDAVLRVAGRVLLDDAREVLDADGRHARDHDVAALRLPRRADLGERAREVGEQAARLRQEVASEARERDRARRTLYELHVEQRLEVLQPARERGLRDVQRVGGALEPAFGGDGDEGLEAEDVELHAKNALILSINSFYLT